MIAHLPLPFLTVAAVPLLAVGVLVVLRRARRPVQVYIGEDERSMSRDLSGARRPAQSPPSTHCRGSARVGPSQKPRPTSSQVAALPLHFRLLRRLGIECRVKAGQ